jgi:hypothetical protein
LRDANPHFLRRHLRCGQKKHDGENPEGAATGHGRLLSDIAHKILSKLRSFTTRFAAAGFYREQENWGSLEPPNTTRSSPFHRLGIRSISPQKSAVTRIGRGRRFLHGNPL